MLKQFYELFNIKNTLEEEQRNFVHRINQRLLDELESYYNYKKTFQFVCYGVGKNANDLIRKASSYTEIIPSLRVLTNDDFLNTLKILAVLYRYFSSNDSDWSIQLNKEITLALSLTPIDLGIKWKDGMFYPTNAGILDQKLIEDPLNWLNNYPDEKKDFSNAIVKYMSKEYGDVVGYCYSTIEGLARQVLKNSKTLDNNRETLLAKAKLSAEWSKILSIYIQYANEYKRHASDKRHNIIPKETEAFLYLTGLLVRLIIE